MGFISEFKEFISKGNVLDLAVGVIIGSAFGKIVSSLTDDIIMPILSVFTSGVNFNEKFFTLDGKHYDTLKSGPGCQSRHHRLRQLHQCHHLLPHHRLRDFLGSKAGQSLQKARRSSGSRRASSYQRATPTGRNPRLAARRPRLGRPFRSTRKNRGLPSGRPRFLLFCFNQSFYSGRLIGRFKISCELRGNLTPRVLLLDARIEPPTSLNR
jgi:hypothetical protein